MTVPFGFPRRQTIPRSAQPNRCMAPMTQTRSSLNLRRPHARQSSVPKVVSVLTRVCHRMPEHGVCVVAQPASPLETLVHITWDMDSTPQRGQVVPFLLGELSSELAKFLELSNREVPNAGTILAVHVSHFRFPILVSGL
jgi:hypothetical protein